MRVLFFAIFFFVGTAVQASSTLRVGNQVLTAGDSQERVVELLGKASSRSYKGASRRHRGRGAREIGSDGGGEQWRYRRDGHLTVVTIVDGRVTAIEDERL